MDPTSSTASLIRDWLRNHSSRRWNRNICPLTRLKTKTKEDMPHWIQTLKPSLTLSSACWKPNSMGLSSLLSQKSYSVAHLHQFFLVLCDYFVTINMHVICLQLPLFFPIKSICFTLNAQPSTVCTSSMYKTRKSTCWRKWWTILPNSCRSAINSGQEQEPKLITKGRPKVWKSNKFRLGFLPPRHCNGTFLAHLPRRAFLTISLHTGRTKEFTSAFRRWTWYAKSRLDAPEILSISGTTSAPLWNTVESNSTVFQKRKQGEEDLQRSKIYKKECLGWRTWLVVGSNPWVKLFTCNSKFFDKLLIFPMRKVRHWNFNAYTE